jgi:hypothetical protein
VGSSARTVWSPTAEKTAVGLAAFAVSEMSIPDHPVPTVEEPFDDDDLDSEAIRAVVAEADASPEEEFAAEEIYAEFGRMDLTRFSGHRDKPVETRRRSVQWQ